jgi:hypothetical protein
MCFFTSGRVKARAVALTSINTTIWVITLSVIKLTPKANRLPITNHMETRDVVDISTIARITASASHMYVVPIPDSISIPPSGKYLLLLYYTVLFIIIQ